MGLETFLAFIDFQKAFDSVDRNLLFYKLSKIGISGHFYKDISSLSSNPKSRVISNEYETLNTCKISTYRLFGHYSN